MIIKNNKIVYVIETDDNYVKVGISNNAKKRFKQIECGSGKKIINYFISESTTNAKKIETLIHKRFIQYRKRGEWFYGIDYKTVLNHASLYDYSNQQGIY